MRTESPARSSRPPSQPAPPSTEAPTSRPPVHVEAPPAQALHFVEDVALLLEREGLPRMAGRVYGWCLICEPQLQSASDLARVLGASKGSISTMTTLLERAQLIQRVARPGDRRDYYCVRPGSMSSLVVDGLRRIVAMRQMMDRGLDLLRDKPEETRARLQDVHDVLAFFEREYPALIQRWEERRRAEG